VLALYKINGARNTNMQNNHDKSHGYQFNGSVNAQSIGDTHYHGSKSELDEVELNIVEESLQTISKRELKLKAKAVKKLQNVFISLLCVECLICFGVAIFFTSAKDIIIFCICVTSLGAIFPLSQKRFIHWYSNRPKIVGENSYVGNHEFMRDEGDHYLIYNVTANCIYDKGNCPGCIEIVVAPPEEAKIGRRIVGKCLKENDHSYTIDINNLIATRKLIDWSNKNENQLQ
jgi:hypothetical protein